MTRFDVFVQPARARSGAWRIPVGLLIILAAWLMGTIAVLSVWSYVMADSTGSAGEDAMLQALDMVALGGHPSRIATMLATFIGVWIGVWTVLSVLHRQSLRTVFAPGPDRRPGGFAAGAGLALIFVLPAFAGAMLLSTPRATGIDLGVWAAWLVPIAGLIFVQAVGEELVFRGYLQQQLAARSRHWLVWAGVPSVLFGLLHFGNAHTFWGGLYYAGATCLMGLILATLVWRTGSLWTAAGVHWANNMAALTILGPEGALSGMQFWVLPDTDTLSLLQIDIGFIVLALVLVVSPVGRALGDGRAVVQR